MNKKLPVLIIALLVLCSGCALVTKAPQLLTLKRLGDSQKQMSIYIDKKKKYLAKLVKDIEENKLSPGMTYRRFLGTYGEPVLEKDTEQEGVSKQLLYRHPTQYFDTDKVYVYFDENLKLKTWKYKKAEK